MGMRVAGWLFSLALAAAFVARDVTLGRFAARPESGPHPPANSLKNGALGRLAILPDGGREFGVFADDQTAHRVERRKATGFLDHAVADLAGLVDQQCDADDAAILFVPGEQRIDARPDQVGERPERPGGLFEAACQWSLGVPHP